MPNPTEYLADVIYRTATLSSLPNNSCTRESWAYQQQSSSTDQQSTENNLPNNNIITNDTILWREYLRWRPSGDYIRGTKGDRFIKETLQ